MARQPAWRGRQILWRQLDSAARWALPGAALLFGFFVLSLPFHIPGQALLRPAYGLGCVYFWSLFRPNSLPAPLACLAGLLLDIMGGTPLGVWALLMLALRTATLATRRRLAPQRFLFSWAAFCAFASAASLLAWAIQAAIGLTLLPLWPVALQIIISASLYPAVAALFVRAHRGPAAVELA